MRWLVYLCDFGLRNGFWVKGENEECFYHVHVCIVIHD